MTNGGCVRYSLCLHHDADTHQYHEAEHLEAGGSGIHWVFEKERGSVGTERSPNWLDLIVANTFHVAVYGVVMGRTSPPRY
jgi:hypothetical protein